jgi:hypothetical protein
MIIPLPLFVSNLKTSNQIHNANHKRNAINSPNEENKISTKNPQRLLPVVKPLRESANTNFTITEKEVTEMGNEAEDLQTVQGSEVTRNGDNDHSREALLGNETERSFSKNSTIIMIVVLPYHRLQ